METISYYCKTILFCSPPLPPLFFSIKKPEFESFPSFLGKKINVQMKCFLIAEFERAAKSRKIALYRFWISLPVPEL